MIVKLPKESRKQRFADILLEICMHEVTRRHPNIVSYHGAFSPSPEEYGLVLEYYDSNLESWIHDQNVQRELVEEDWSVSAAVATHDLLSGSTPLIAPYARNTSLT